MPDDIEQSWRPETISEAAARTLHSLARSGLLADFYLAGGTGLALQLGHRRSVDFDFFSSAAFDVDSLVQQLGTLGSLSVISKGVNTLHVHIGGVKASFLTFDYPLLFAMRDFQGALVGDWRDIACMKINAIAGRGSRRDFIDVFAAAQRSSLRMLLDFFQRKFAAANFSTVHLLKSLTYFDEADREPMPDMLMAASWDEVKGFFISQGAKLMRQ